MQLHYKIAIIFLYLFAVVKMKHKTAKKSGGKKKFKPTVLRKEIKKLTKDGKLKLTKQKKATAMRKAWA